MPLSANAPLTEFVAQSYEDYLVGASVHIYQGGFVGLDPAGYAKAFVPGDMFAGVAYEEADNSSGAAGAIRVRTQVADLDFEYTLTSVALTDVGKPVFATADNAIALTGHPDAFVGWIVSYVSTNKARIRLREPGETPPNGKGSIVIKLTGHEAFAATGATAGDECVDGFELESALGLGVLPTDAEDGGVTLQFDATAEIALASVRTFNDCFPVDKGLTFEVDLVVADKGDNAALDIDWGFGTALTTNSEANIDHADMVQLACFHMDGNSDNILAQSDDNTTDVANTDTTIDNDSTTDVSKKFKIVVRPTGSVEFWIAGARVLSSTTFALLSTAVVGAFVNVEKTSDDTTAVLIFKNLRIGAGAAA
jgi:hypothetical protein